LEVRQSVILLVCWDKISKWLCIFI